MQIKKKIILSNIMMVIIPIILTGLVSIVLIRGLVHQMTEHLKSYKKSCQNIKNMDKLLESYELSYIEEEARDERESSRIKLVNLCKNRGFSLLILKDEEVYYSNLNAEHEQAIEDIKSQRLSSNSGLEDSSLSEVLGIETDLERQYGCRFGEKSCLLERTFTKDQEKLTVKAINIGFKYTKEYTLQMLLKTLVDYIGMIIIFAVLIFCITNGVLASGLARSLLKPLNLLSYGARQIELGNLAFKMEYDQLDEFGGVCQQFDNMRQQLKASLELQDKYEQNRRELLAGISHDLRTPLTAIKGYVKGLQVGIANTPEKQEKYLKIIDAKVCELDELVDKLFMVSKLDTGQYPFHFERVGVKDYLEHFYREVEEQHKDKLEVIYENRSKPESNVQIDTEEIKRVLVNIVQNSLKYNVNPNPKLWIEATEEDEWAKWVIRDNGEGVSDEQLEKLFMSFYRTDAARTKPNEGSGLGLAIAEKIIRAHQGKIYAKNCGGLAIIIQLPLEKSII